MSYIRLNYVNSMTWRQRCLAPTLLATAAGAMVLLSVNNMPLSYTITGNEAGESHFKVPLNKEDNQIQLIPECDCGRRMDKWKILPLESGEW